MCSRWLPELERNVNVYIFPVNSSLQKCKLMDFVKPSPSLAALTTKWLRYVYLLLLVSRLKVWQPIFNWLLILYLFNNIFIYFYNYHGAVLVSLHYTISIWLLLQVGQPLLLLWISYICGFIFLGKGRDLVYYLIGGLLRTQKEAWLAKEDQAFSH